METSTTALTAAPLVYVCKTCHARFPHRYGWRSSVVTRWWGSPFADCDGALETIAAAFSLPLVLVFAALWVPMEMAFPPCPMCGHGIVRRDTGPRAGGGGE